MFGKGPLLLQKYILLGKNYHSDIESTWYE